MIPIAHLAADDRLRRFQAPQASGGVIRARELRLPLSMIGSGIPPDSKLSRRVGPMTLTKLESVVKNLNTRVDRVEQFLPTLATKQDLLATQRDLDATQQDLVATQRDLVTSQQELRAELRAEMRATRQELLQAMSALEERLRSQMLMLHEDARSENRLLAEHLDAAIERWGRHH
jgi:hypothetical protein